MITVVDYIGTYKHRAAGWIQDASSFSNLHRFVSAFSHHSTYRNELIGKIQRFVENDLAQRFLESLDRPTIDLKYQDIVGSAPSGSRRHKTTCNGIGQAAINGQKREYQGDWSTNNFLRWAESLQFVEYSPSSDTYKITEVGESYVKASAGERYEIVKQQLAMYPPAIRVLALLDESAHTKFSLGERLGFIGEKGFTNISEKLFVDIYHSTDSPEERKKLKSDYEGSSDKYARQICSWLVSLKLVEPTKKELTHDNETLSLRSYNITPLGREFLRKARISNHRFVPFGMLSMEDSNKGLICKRRALVLKSLSEDLTSIEDIISLAGRYGVTATESEIDDDILSLQNMGLNIIRSGADSYRLKDIIDGLYIPRVVAPTILSKALSVKEKLRSELKYIDHNLLVLIDFAYGSNRTARLFEVYVAKVYEQIYSDTYLLGGASKPDVVVCSDKFVMIIDAKAYGKGFSLPQTERDKMVRYIEEYRQRDSSWHKIIEDAVKTDFPIFQFVSSEFNSVEDKLFDIAHRTDVNGSAIAAENLLRIVDNALAKNNRIDVTILTANQQITLE